MNLLYPKYLQCKNSLFLQRRTTLLQAVVLFCVGILFWAGLFIVFYRVLVYFQSIEVLGNFLAAKLLSMVLLTFFSILVFSTIITAISVFFLSEELNLIISMPYDPEDLYHAKLLETILNSSWMVLLFSLPVFLSYGIVFHQGGAYYGILAATLPPFLCICGTLGAGIALGLVKTFPARRLKDILFLLSLLVLVVIYLLFRFLKPERLVDPEVFVTVIDYLSSLDMPAAPFLPSQWMTDCLATILFSRTTTDVGFNLGLLWSTAAALVIIVGWLFQSLYFGAWSKAQEARSVKITSTSLFAYLLEKALRPFPLQVQALVAKDIRCFFRDTAQWSQLIILGAIIIIYLYNFSVLPLDKSPIPLRYFQNVIAFLNLGLAGFVLAAVAVRFGFPAISMEGEVFWLIAASPLTLRRFVWCKFWMIFAILSFLGQVLIVCTNILLHTEKSMMILSSVTIFLMTFGISSLSIGVGAAYPKFRYENVAQISTGFGGFLSMIIALLYILLMVVIEALPVHLVIMADMARRSLTWREIVLIGISFCTIVVLTVVACIVPMQIGLKKLAAREVL